MLLDFIFPRYCVICGKRLETDETAICLMCNAMLPRLNWMSSPYDNPLALSYLGKVEFEKAVAFMRFQPGTKTANLIYGKYFSNSSLCRYLGELIALEAEGTDFFSDIDIIVPMPLSASRELHRGFNQCCLIAEGISRKTGIPIAYNAIIRNHFSKSQTRTTRYERSQNVEAVFSVLRRDILTGRHVLLLDDIITTGSTTLSCAKEILKVPDTKVSFLGFGKTSSI